MGRWAQRQRGRGAGVTTARPTLVIEAVHDADGGILTFDQQVEITVPPYGSEVKIDANDVTDAVQIDPYTVHCKTGSASDPADPWDISGEPSAIIPAVGSGPIAFPQSGLLT